MTDKNKRGRSFQLIFIVIIAFTMLYIFGNANRPTEQYYEILDLYKEGKVSAFNLNLGTGKLNYSLAEDKEGVLGHTYNVADPSQFREDVAPYIEAYNLEHPDAPMKYDYTATASIWSVLLNIVPYLMLIGLVVFFYISMSQQGGRGIASQIGKVRVKDGQEDGRRATFEDVAGAEEEKYELQEIVEYLKNPGQFNNLGAKIPTGVLLVGPPGTGKTLMARAVAGEAGVPFFSLTGSEFVELYVGIGASRVRDLFDKAKKARPSIIFIDEIDAVGRRRGAGLGGGNDEREQTLNQLLVEMDGFGTNEGVIVMAATNRADVLDPALLRPGRFDREIYIGYPDVKGREEILKVHSRGKPLGPDVDLKTIARTTIGFTGADLENLLNEAALLAARRHRKAITEIDIEEASLKVVAGPEKKSRVVTPKERRLTAFHEAGHAIATYFATPDTPVHQISITPRGMAGGFTMSLPSEDSNYMTKNQMASRIVTLLGGRVAEKLVLDDISTGASNDLQRVTELARSMVTRYGFSEKLGPVVFDSDRDEVFLGRDFATSRGYSEQVASDIDSEVHRIIGAAYDECIELLSSNRDKLDLVAEELLRREKLDGEDFKKIMLGQYVPPALPDPEKTAEDVVEPDVADDSTLTVESDAESDTPTKMDTCEEAGKVGESASDSHDEDTSIS